MPVPRPFPECFPKCFGEMKIIMVKIWGKKKKEKQGRRDSISRMRLGRGSNMRGRGGERCRIHESISHVRLGRSGDAKTARRVHVWCSPSTCVTDRRTDGPTDGRTDMVTYRSRSTRQKKPKNFTHYGIIQTRKPTLRQRSCCSK